MVIKDAAERHLKLINQAKGDESAEFGDLQYDITATDTEYIPEYIRLSTLSIGLSLVENLLGELSEEIANILEIDIELDRRPLPYINRYILWLSRVCGVSISISKSEWKKLDAMRELRNRFMHRIDRDLPSHVQKVISEMIGSLGETDKSITNEFIDVSLKEIGTLVKTIELAYLQFLKRSDNT